MHYLQANRQELQSFAVLCGGPILGGVLGGEGGRLHPRLWQNEIGELCQNATVMGEEAGTWKPPVPAQRANCCSSQTHKDLAASEGEAR